MALNTTDVTIAVADSWTAVVLTGTVINITRITHADIEIRFGITSTSRGFILASGSTIQAAETFYARAIVGGNTDHAIITVVKD